MFKYSIFAHPIDELNLTLEHIDDIVTHDFVSASTEYAYMNMNKFNSISMHGRMFSQLCIYTKSLMNRYIFTTFQNLTKVISKFNFWSVQWNPENIESLQEIRGVHDWMN